MLQSIWCVLPLLACFALHFGCAVKTLLGLQFFNWVIITLSLICSCLLQLTHSPRSIPTYLSPSNLSQHSNSFISTRFALVEKNVWICFCWCKTKMQEEGGRFCYCTQAAVKQLLLNVKEGNCFTSAESRNRDNAVVLEEVIK